MMRSTIRAGGRHRQRRCPRHAISHSVSLPLAAIALVLVLAGCAGSSGSSAPATSATPHATPRAGEQVTLHGSDSWVVTHVSVTPGERLTVGCDGKATLPNAQGAVGPSGSEKLAQGSGFPLAGVYAGGVIGRIGGGNAFYVGAFFDHTLVTTTGSGALALRMNAAPGSASGAFTCRVSVQRFPAQPIASTLYGNAVVKIDDPQHQGFAGPYNDTVALTSVTDGSRTLIELTSFPALSVGPISTQAGDDTITITAVDIFGAFGPYGPTSTLTNGDITGLPLTLRFHNSLDIAGTCTAPFTFTTGTSVSPGGHFRVTGTPVSSGGDVVLVGTSKFSCNALFNPTDGMDVQMTINGVLSPSPVN